MSLVTIKIFNYAEEAQIVKSRLESYEINCYLFDENMVSTAPFYTTAIGGIKLKVDSNDVQTAQGIIAETYE